jgi:hypothetical protein
MRESQRREHIDVSVLIEDSKQQDRAKDIFVKGCAHVSYTGEASVEKDHKTAEPYIAAK